MGNVDSGISIREFARRDGCSDTLVRKALKSGHLVALPDGMLDPALVGTGWRKNNRGAANDGSRGSRGSEAISQTAEAPDLDDIERDADAFVRQVLAGNFAELAQAEKVKENALAVKNLLAVRKQAGALVEIETAEAVLFEAARSARDAWINWPARIGPLVAADLGVPADKATEVLTGYVHQQLAELGEPEADFAAEE